MTIIKVFVRNRSKRYGNQSLLFPYQTVMWFKPVNKMDRHKLFSHVAKFHQYLVSDLKWSSGALGKVAPQLIDTTTSIGILFSHKKYANEALEIYKEKNG